MINLSSFGCHANLHGLRAGEFPCVPGQVSLAIGVLYVQPKDVVGDVILVKILVHTEREGGRERGEVPTNREEERKERTESEERGGDGKKGRGVETGRGER